jgi:CRP-like cAMP-binding protein
LEAFQRFLSNYHVRKYAKGEIILVQGEVPTSGLVIKKGVIKTYNLTAQGEEKPISFDIAGEIIPIGWVFHKIKYAQYYYEAFTDCEIYSLPRDEYLAYLRSNPDQTLAHYSNFVGRYLNYQMRVNALEQSKAAAKVINTIHFLALRFGVDVKPNVVKIQLPFTQQDLANYMGLTRETTGIELKKLQRSGVLTYRRQYYMVNTDKLADLLDDDYETGRVMDV